MTPISSIGADAPAAYTWADCLYVWTQAAEAHGIHVRLTGRRVGGPQVRMPLIERWAAKVLRDGPKTLTPVDTAA